MSFYKKNEHAWDQLAVQRSQFTRLATDEECAAPLKTLDSRGWLPESVVGKKVLCLASGGGWQSILYACAGAEVTVVDLSSHMLQLDRQEADRRDLNVTIVQTSMDDLSMLEDDQFDIVHQPVSTCYVSDLLKVYEQIARVSRTGAIYISQHKQPTSLQISHRDAQDRYVLGLEYYQRGALPPVEDKSYREKGATEFLHRWEDLVGGLCRTGFVLEDLREPCRADYSAPAGHFRHRGRYVAPYVRLKARRLPREVETHTTRKQLWTPE
ncbi:bifunctional 3-demethylubiquinone-9 3-methyltransferase/ 2-octaprenyl-6-hydroxy phenol methylase [Polystyrenella longa]|uniref:Bifunctional 3-demethylubiquinone-9 3-methyltransferase/ 2-octaprenyl-6-hydroxy phenol methylase n=1 Tax=Polystyrenella longa TaxID=2528007 RepID=A0A518CJ06_9PLAN|nr:class I SAM-dependent methyltransferase [Polystyrenella longa]QDU79177.1 bifunctional 3-demethylubiquinone-9 3-methyltransferase/ 2-octaprenyl-6-hydroxy phenol methylase [Polystyrenella longa]